MKDKIIDRIAYVLLGVFISIPIVLYYEDTHHPTEHYLFRTTNCDDSMCTMTEYNLVCWRDGNLCVDPSAVKTWAPSSWMKKEN